MRLSTKSYPAASVGEGTAYAHCGSPMGHCIWRKVRRTNAPGLVDRSTGHGECK